MNKEEMKGDWEQFKGKAKQKWATLGDTDLALYASGKRDEFVGKIREATGKNKEEAERELKEFEKSCGCSSSDKAA